MRFPFQRSARELDAADWVLRGGVAAFFVLMGVEKFPSGAGAPWVATFQQIGLGPWFRYLTGAIEIGGALLYLLPWTCIAGIALLGCTMLGAMAVHIVVRHSVGASLYPAIVLAGVILIAMRRPDEPMPSRVASRRG
jgi:putative oxidoreductase